jgi:hypothetical protein
MWTDGAGELLLLMTSCMETDLHPFMIYSKVLPMASEKLSARGYKATFFTHKLDKCEFVTAKREHYTCQRKQTIHRDDEYYY